MCVFQGLGTDEETLIEILCSRSSDEMAEIKKVYAESECEVCIYTMPHPKSCAAVFPWLLLPISSPLSMCCIC